MLKGGEELRVGQDVYLENNLDIPYVARLQEIFAYAFAPTEVYFNARWYYREDDTHEYAKMSGAKGDVEYEGERLTAEPKELFFSLHLDENHADCILRKCTVFLPEKRPPGGQWDALKQHQYIAYRAYDAKKVFALSSLPSRKLREAYALEAKRTPRQQWVEPARPKPKPAAFTDADKANNPLSNDELRALWLPRKHVEVWHETSAFSRVVSGSLVRCAQMVNGQRTFFVAFVLGVKRSRPYRINKDKVTDLALQVRASTQKLIGIDTLSNQAPTDVELARFKVPLEPSEVRKKIRALQQAMQESATLFEEEDVRRKEQEEERLRAQTEAAREAEEREAEERERKEREREELRRRQALKSADSEQWWLKYQHKGGDKTREIAKWRARLARFEKIANSSTAEGEKENARRLAEQAQAKVEALTSQSAEEE